MSPALNLRVQLHDEDEGSKERNGGIPTTGVEGKSKSPDVRLRLGVEDLSTQEFRTQWTKRHGTALMLVRVYLNPPESPPSVPARHQETTRERTSKARTQIAGLGVDLAVCYDHMHIQIPSLQ